MIIERPLIRIASNLLWYDARLFNRGAGAAHTLQRSLGENLLELALPMLDLGTEQRDGCLALARFLAAHTGALHLPNFAARDLMHAGK